MWIDSGMRGRVGGEEGNGVWAIGNGGKEGVLECGNLFRSVDMGDSALILGVSGLRGVVGESLTPEVAVRYAAAFGSWLCDQVDDGRWPRVVVGRDGRFGGEMVQSAVFSGLMGVGCRTRGLCVAMTPSVGVSCDTMSFDAAMIITASHNGQAWNGIKILVRPNEWTKLVDSDCRGTPGDGLIDACAPSAIMAEDIIERFESGKIAWQENVLVGGFEWDDDTNSKHCLAVKRACERLDGKLWNEMLKKSGLTRVVTDSLNASSAMIDFEFYNKGSIELVQIAGGTSGMFQHTPEPTRENLSGEGGLCDMVPGVKADVGFAQDPDGDRLAVVDELGEYIGEEYTLVLCAMAIMEARMCGGGEEKTRLGEPGHLEKKEKKGKPVFVVNLSTSRMIDDVAGHYGAEVVRSAVGEANVVEVMKKLSADGRDVVMGGEGNGGVIWAEVTYVRDSLSGMALILALMARTGKTVSELVSMINGMGPTDEVKGDGYTILKAKSDLAKKSDANPVVQHLNKVYSKVEGCRVDLVDGIRIDWDERGVWAHVRASNTEAIMRVIVEAPSAEEAARVAGEIEGEIQGIGT